MVNEGKYRKHKFLFGGIGFGILGIGLILGFIFLGGPSLIDRFSIDTADTIGCVILSLAPLAFIFAIIGIIKDKISWPAWILTIITGIIIPLELWLIYFIIYCFPKLG